MCRIETIIGPSRRHNPTAAGNSVSGRVWFALTLLSAGLILLASPVFGAWPSNLPGLSTSHQTVTSPSLPSDETIDQTLETIRQKIDAIRIRRQEIHSALAAKNPPTYASFAELSERQILLFTTRLHLESWRGALINIQKTQQAERDLESKIQSWAGFGIEPPYPLSMVDHLAAEIRSKHLELQTEQARTTLESDQIPNYRRELEQAGSDVRRAAEVLEKGRGTNEARLRWLLETAQIKEQLAEGRLQSVLAKVELNKLRVALLERENDFLEEQLAQTTGKIEFSRDSLDSRLKAISDKREQLARQLVVAERKDNDAQEQVVNARSSLEADLAAEGRNERHLRQLFELRKVEAETTAQRVETLKLLLAANTLETILYQERYRIYQGIEKTQDLAEVIGNLDLWLERISEIKDYFTAKSQLARSQIKAQKEILQDWPEIRPGKPIEEAKLEAYQARISTLDELIASTEMLDFLSLRLRDETSAEKNSRSFVQRFQIALNRILGKVSSIWNYEVFSVEDTIVADGKVISGSRPVTLKKLISGLLLLTLGIWAVGRTAKILSHLAQRRLNVERNLILLFEKTGHFVAVMTVIVVALGLVQIPITAFAFLGGALAIGVGFGGQNLINNFMSSLILLLEKPIKVGDVVEAEGVLGRVTSIGGRCSTIRRFDGVDLLVPNSQLLEKTVVNRTLSDNLVRYEIKVGVAYGSPTREVFHILEQVVDEHGLVLKDPKPAVYLEAFDDYALLFGIYYWIEINDKVDVRGIASDLRHRIDRLFRDAGITIAFPQRDVHLDTLHPLKIQMVNASESAADRAEAGEPSAVKESETPQG